MSRGAWERKMGKRTKGNILSEHGWWGKVMMPYFNEIAHIPLFIWDPRTGVRGERRQALVQTIDLAPTILEYFGQEIPENMQGHSLCGTILRDDKIREYALFGQHGVHGGLGKVSQRRAQHHDGEQAVHGLAAAAPPSLSVFSVFVR